MIIPGSAERYAPVTENRVTSVAAQRFSTFSVDVDTASYANVRRFLSKGTLPPPDAVRVEEMMNYFRYDLPKPADRSKPFSLTTDAAITPWNPQTRLVRIALRGYDVARNERPAANLVFLIDVSGSMSDPDKLPLVKSTLGLLIDRLQPKDHVSIVVYAGRTAVVAEPGNDREKLRAALASLEAGGSTDGASAIALAYEMARKGRIAGGINRIILATDGDFNVGISEPKELKTFIERNRDDGITFTSLGFGTGNFHDTMLETLADAGNGNYAYIDGIEEARKVLDDEMSSTLFTIAKDVKIQVEFNPAVVAEYRLIGYENRLLDQEDFDNDEVDAGDIGAGHQVTALYEVALKGSKGRRLKDGRYAPPIEAAKNSDELARVQLRYKAPNAKKSQLMERILAAQTLREAGRAKGDFAFAASVAAFGQKLRGGKYLGDYSYDDIETLAGPQQDYRRQGFISLVRSAKAITPGTQ